MGLRDDMEDAPGKEPVRVEMTERDSLVLMSATRNARTTQSYIYDEISRGRLSAPVEAALHDFALGLDELIKDTLNKVRDDG